MFLALYILEFILSVYFMLKIVRNMLDYESYLSIRKLLLFSVLVSLYLLYCIWIYEMTCDVIPEVFSGVLTAFGVQPV